MTESFDERAVFLGALNLREEDRQAFLQGACPDAESLARVQKLLKSHAAGFSVVRPAVDERAESVADESPRHIGAFRVIRELGRGGMGVVYLASDDVLGRHIALKVLGTQLATSPSAAEGLHREARTAAALSHSGIVPVYQFGFDGNRCFIASEYVDGPTLRKVIDDERAERTKRGVPHASREWLERSARIISSLAETLDYCHRHNVIHRDVKPSNVLMDPIAGPRLTDFGIAWAGNARQSVGALEGTCHYMSPEQATRHSVKIDARSDVFSTGVVLYEMLALRRPFEGKDPERIIASIRNVPEPSLRSIDRSVPADLHTICQKCLEKRPEDRYQTAAHVAAELRCWLADEPILARPMPLTRRFARVFRRHRTLSLIVGIAAVIVGAMAAAFIDYRHGSMGQIVIPESMAGSQVTCERLEENGGPGGEPMDLGRPPLKRYLKPGLYLVVFAFPDGARLEAVTLQTPGSTDLVSMNRPNPLYTANFVRIEGRDHIVGVPGVAPPGRAARSVRLGAMRVSATEVTNGEYRAFRLAGLGSDPAVWRQPYDPAEDDLPVAGVSWDQANEYCRWRGVRMPTAMEWEAAARAPDGRAFPWGDDPNTEIFRNTSREVSAYHNSVRSVRDDTRLESPLGLHHLNSNVAEFVASIAEDLNSSVIVKGRSYRGDPNTPSHARSALPGRHLYSPDVGFRVMIKE